jgi:predicted metal-dependent hydrolase
VQGRRGFFVGESGGPIKYSLKVNSRAKRVTLRVNAPEGLVIVVPRGFSKGKVSEIIEEKRSWIEKALSRVLPLSSSEDISDPPETFFSPAIGKSLELDKNFVKGSLRIHAVDHITPLAWGISRESGLRPERFTIKNQKSIWGSCSSNNNINLNQRLLFLEPHLVRYVILHELCHLRHRNHSADFWAFLREFDPSCLSHRRDIKEAQRNVPHWAY